MDMPSNIDEFVHSLPEPVLRALAVRINARLDSLSKQTKTHSFKLGDPVTFIHKGLTYFATVIRINPKTISVVENSTDRRQWNVSPSLLSPLHNAAS